MKTETCGLSFAFLLCVSYCAERPRLKKHVEFYLTEKWWRKKSVKPTSHQWKVGLWTAEIILVNQMDSDTQVQLSKWSLFSQKPRKDEWILPRDNILVWEERMLWNAKWVDCIWIGNLTPGRQYRLVIFR